MLSCPSAESPVCAALGEAQLREPGSLVGSEPVILFRYIGLGLLEPVNVHQEPTGTMESWVRPIISVEGLSPGFSDRDSRSLSMPRSIAPTRYGRRFFGGIMVCSAPTFSAR